MRRSASNHLRQRFQDVRRQDKPAGERRQPVDRTREDRVTTYYYDESNNHRKLWIDPERRAYNIDNDTGRKVPVGRNFLLGGVVHYGSESTANVAALIESFRLQQPANEVKFKHLASGTFESILKSKKVSSLLKWLVESDLYLHFFNVNLENWAFLDIIDDCLMWCGEIQIPFLLESFDDVNRLKDALYRIVRMDRTGFLDLACSYGYPNLAGKTAAFMEALTQHVRKMIASSEHEDEMEEDGLQESIEYLLSLFDCCAGIDDMTLVQQYEDGVLVDGLSCFYQFIAEERGEGLHIMDMEQMVERELKLRAPELTESGRISFVDSKQNRLVQVSDLVSGMVARYFQFIDDNNHLQLVQALESMSKEQLANLDLLRQLFDKSHDKNHTLLHRSVTLGELEKSDLVLYPDHFYRGV
jgi:hypothetical protein